MAGTLQLSKELCWMPAGWVYDNTLERIAERLETSAPELQQRLLASLTEVNGGYLDLQRCDSTALRTLSASLAVVTAKVISSGPNAMHNPSFYDGYVQQLQELYSLLIKRMGELEESASARR